MFTFQHWLSFLLGVIMPWSSYISLSDAFFCIRMIVYFYVWHILIYLLTVWIFRLILLEIKLVKALVQPEGKPSIALQRLLWWIWLVRLSKNSFHLFSNLNHVRVGWCDSLRKLGMDDWESRLRMRITSVEWARYYLGLQFVI